MIWVKESESYNPFDVTTTGTSLYDNFLNPKDLEYYQTHKNLTGDIVYMSPSAYFEACAEMFRNHGYKDSTVKSLIKSRTQGKEAEKIERYMKMMKDGVKFHLPYIFAQSGHQEGLHRMYCAGELYGWDTEFPVLVVEPYDQGAWDTKEAIKAIDNISYWVNDSSFNNEMYFPNILWKVANKYRYDFSDSCIPEIEEAFVQGCKEDGYSVSAYVNVDVNSDKIELYITSVEGLSVPEDYQAITEESISNYFNSINGEDIEEEKVDTIQANDVENSIDYDYDFDEFQKMVNDDNLSDAILKHFFKRGN